MTVDPDVVSAIFKAYDVRGTVPDQLDDELARGTGAAFVVVTAATRRRVGKRHVDGHRDRAPIQVDSWTHVFR